jgi:hypothetical protein
MSLGDAGVIIIHLWLLIHGIQWQHYVTSRLESFADPPENVEPPSVGSQFDAY